MSPAFGGRGGDAVKLSTAHLMQGEGRQREKKQRLRKTEVSNGKKTPPIKLEIKLSAIKYQYRFKMLARFVVQNFKAF